MEESKPHIKKSNFITALLLFLGFTTNLYAEFTLGNWTVINNLNIARSSNVAVLARDSIIYTIGGYGYPSSPIYGTERAIILPDGTISAWNLESSQNIVEREFAVGFSNDTFIYIVGGNDFYSIPSTVERASINSNGSISLWTTIGTLPASFTSSSGIKYNDYFYVIGGFQAKADIYRTTINPDGSLGTWMLLSTKLNIGRHAHMSIALDTIIYVVGGAFSSGITRTVEKAVIFPDGELSAFTIISNTVAFHGGRDLIYDGDYLYVIENYAGGTLGYQSERAKILPDWNLGPWEPAPRLNNARGSMALVQTNNGVYSIGGTNGSDLTTVEYAPILNTTDIRKEKWEFLE